MRVPGTAGVRRPAVPRPRHPRALRAGLGDRVGGPGRQRRDRPGRRRGRYTPTPAVSHAILAANRGKTTGLADGIVVTPSHNPPRDGGFKYNPPHGGPADTGATGWIAGRANDLLRAGLSGVRRVPLDQARRAVDRYDFLGSYVDDLPNAVDLDAIRDAGVRIGADPWGRQRRLLGRDRRTPPPGPHRGQSAGRPHLAVHDPGLGRQDPHGLLLPSAMASLVGRKEEFQIATGNDADADRHGIVTPDRGLMNPNHFLAVAIAYLLSHRPGWAAEAAVGKTLVSSSLIDRVVADLGRTLVEVPVGFKWFVPGLLDGSVGFGGEESAGASFLRRDGSVWTTDKDGILLALLASEIQAVTGRSPRSCTSSSPTTSASPPTPASTLRPPASRSRPSASSPR
ncbi:phosphoglucomutase [Blastococcus brunescens]|uniref:Phosphoglucomutase n=1 Tax=Blastococcus brunescens TaxID=1564165 RepID=A0ABZ1B918_9ACTN|nr:phosphoglucomutase [Blastococcus sp. BMG 8361]WRL67229.1 phosphoglucomutase [Blastococcus sp. BMG 8361]